MTVRKLCAASSIAVGLLGALVLVIAPRVERGRPHHPPPPPALAPAQSVVIDIGTGATVLRSLPSEERPEQWRDWAVYGALPRLGAKQGEAKIGTYRMPPARLPYLRDLYVFDYGYGRRLYLGDRVLLFYDEAAPDAQAVIGRLADLVRMETGKKRGAELYAFRVDPEHGTIMVTRMPDVAESELFGAAYGYVEGNAASLDEFASLLGKIDDVTYSHVRGNEVELGGRRFSHTRTRGLTVQDVAALYQANVGVERAQKALKDKLDDAAYAAEAGMRRQERPDANDFDAAMVHAKAQAEFDKQAEQIERDSGVPSAPGFSLDPQFLRTQRDGHVVWDLATDLDKLASDPCGTVSQAKAQALELVLHGTSDASARATREWRARELILTPSAPCSSIPSDLLGKVRAAARDIAAASDKDSESHFVAYYELDEATRDSDDPASDLVHAMLQYFDGKDRVQCARYDGPRGGTAGTIQGTNVAMNLFYTDLLAKLWAGIDYHRSAPLDRLPGMLTGPRTRVDPTFAAEDDARPSTRLWFGPRADAVARDGERALMFRYIATRVYAAGSNPVHPGKEEQPAEWARRVLTWWDRHYEEVASYEPQYQLQNEIMKWSLITAQMARNYAEFLSTVEVDRSKRFDTWLAQHHQELRYPYPVAVRPESPSGTECIDLLSSYIFEDSAHVVAQLTGGVSLGGEESLDALASVEEDGALGTRFRPTHDIGAGNAGTAWRTWPELDDTGSVAAIVSDDKTALTRAEDADFHLGANAHLRVESTSDGGLSAAISGDDVPVGRLDVAVEDDRTVLSWSSQEAEVAHSVAERASGHSATVAPEEVASGRGSPIVIADRDTVIVPDGTHDALSVSQYNSTDGFIVHSGDAAVSHLDDEALAKRLDPYGWERISIDPAAARYDTSGAVVRTFTHDGPPPSARHVVLEGAVPGGAPLDAVADGSGIWIAKPADEAGRAAWSSLDQTMDLRPSVIEKVMSSDRPVLVSARGGPPVAAAITEGDFRSALLALDPATLGDPQALATSLETAADELGARAQLELAYGNVADAAPLHELAGAFLKQSPDALLGDVLTDLGLDRPRSALEAVNEILAKRLGTADDLHQLEQATQRLGVADIGDYVASARGVGTIDRAAMPSLQPVVGADGRLGLRYAPASPIETTHIPPGAHGSVHPSDVVYVDDRLRLNREGSEAEIDPDIGDWAEDSHQVWEVAPPIGTYPMVIESGGVSYSRIATKARSPIPSGGGPILLIRSCDASRDRDCK